MYLTSFSRKVREKQLAAFRRSWLASEKSRIASKDVPFTVAAAVPGPRAYASVLSLE